MQGGTAELIGDGLHGIRIHAGYARLAGFRIGDPLLIGFAHAIDRDGNLASLFATDRHGERIVEISSQ